MAISLCFSLVSAAYCQDKIWKIAIFRTEPPHSVEMEEGLKKGLEKLGYAEGKNINFLPTGIVGENVEELSETATQIQAVLALKPDIVAPIGTQASIPARSVLEATGIPMVFAGVTYPVKVGLIEAFGRPTRKNRTGISYAVPLRQRLEITRKLFPDVNKFRTVAFAYSSQILQDVAYADELRSLGNLFGWEIMHIDFFDYAQSSLSRRKLIRALKEKKPDILFGWYGFDQFTGQEKNAAGILDAYRKPILAVTSKFLARGAVAGILSDHADLGFVQAKMIDRIIKGENAGDIPPVEPTGYLLMLNLKKAKELGIKFAPDLIESASRVIK